MKTLLLFLIPIVFCCQSCILGEGIACLRLQIENKSNLKLDSILVYDVFEDTTYIHRINELKELNTNGKIVYDEAMGGLERKINFRLDVFFSNGKKLSSSTCFQEANSDVFTVEILTDKINIEKSHYNLILKLLIYILIFFLFKIVPFLALFKPKNKLLFTLKNIALTLGYILAFKLLIYILSLNGFVGLIAIPLLFIAIPIIDSELFSNQDSIKPNAKKIALTVAVNIVWIIVSIYALAFFH